jgi:predicted GIY-YIG superfamily endonuclease
MNDIPKQDSLSFNENENVEGKEQAWLHASSDLFLFTNSRERFFVYFLFRDDELPLLVVPPTNNDDDQIYSRYKKLPYCGKTNNLWKRYRQHRRMIQGGAKKTNWFKDNVILCVAIGGFESEKQALSFEWRCQKYTPKKIVRGEQAVWQRLVQLMKPMNTTSEKDTIMKKKRRQTTKGMYKNYPHWDEVVQTKLYVLAHPAFVTKLQCLLQVLKPSQLFTWTGLSQQNTNENGMVKTKSKRVCVKDSNDGKIK